MIAGIVDRRHDAHLQGAQIGLLVAAFEPADAVVEQRQQIAQLEREVAEASERLDQIDAEVARWSDPAYIEAQARDRLFYVYPGDTSYLVLGGDTSPLIPDDDVPVTDSVQTESVDWIDAFLSSVYTAGLTTSPAPGDAPVVDSPAQEGSG